MEVDGTRHRAHLGKTWWNYVKEDLTIFGQSREDEQVMGNENENHKGNWLTQVYLEYGH